MCALRSLTGCFLFVRWVQVSKPNCFELGHPSLRPFYCYAADAESLATWIAKLIDLLVRSLRSGIRGRHADPVWMRFDDDAQESKDVLQKLSSNPTERDLGQYVLPCDVTWAPDTDR